MAIHRSIWVPDDEVRPHRLSVEAKKLLKNPTTTELRDWARKDEITTCYGSPSYITHIRSRSAASTYIVSDDIQLGVLQRGWTRKKANKLKKQVHDYLRRREVIQIDRVMGNSDRKLTMRMYITRSYARIAMMLQSMYFQPYNNQENWSIDEIDLVTIYVPELNTHNRQILADIKQRTTYITGTDYFGEAKKSFLRQAMHCAKDWGGLGLHAGSKTLRVRNDDGELIEQGFIMFGLSGTGKTTLTIHDHGLKGEEQAIIRQDDVILMMPDGYCYGTEAGFFIKTDGLDERQELLFGAAKSKDAVFENVLVDEGTGVIDFNDCTLTRNGRGVLMRRDIDGIEEKADLEKVHNVIFITRRDDVVPALARLTPEQAAAFFMLGESVETGAGDPTKRGQSKRCVGTNPFIVGPESSEGNRFLQILRYNPYIKCYLLNTGRVGTSHRYGTTGQKITVSVSAGLMREIATKTIRWEKDPFWGYDVAVGAKDADLNGYDPREYFTVKQYDAINQELRKERLAWLKQFPGLDEEIIRTIEMGP